MEFETLLIPYFVSSGWAIELSLSSRARAGSSIAEINRNDLRDVRHLYTAVGNRDRADISTAAGGCDRPSDMCEALSKDDQLAHNIGADGAHGWIAKCRAYITRDRRRP